ncbi:MAG TPA: GNAT family N-acetyltransferase [Acidimicrobiales bacterium]|nr:GNAT family N-acetyltransferase [Acidimicrobiales bacterium]
MEEKILAARGHRWVLFDRADRSFIGWAGLDPAAANEYELGYRLLRVHWGKGLATEASIRLLQLAFTEWGAERVWAQTMAVNQRSRAVMERCGLRFVRTFHLKWDDPLPGTDEGEVEYELRRTDWRNG